MHPEMDSQRPGYGLAQSGLRYLLSVSRLKFRAHRVRSSLTQKKSWALSLGTDHHWPPLGVVFLMLLINLIISGRFLMPTVGSLCDAAAESAVSM